MILHLRSCRTGVFARMPSNVYARVQALRLRAPSSLPQTSAAVRERRSCIDESEHATVLGTSGRDPIAVCWHPPKPFPYEHTKPVERTEEELREGRSPLRVDLQLQFKHLQLRKGIRPLPELQDMFYTHTYSFYKKQRAMRIAETMEPRPVNRKGL